jgi:hypothetical protein
MRWGAISDAQSVHGFRDGRFSLSSSARQCRHLEQCKILGSLIRQTSASVCECATLASLVRAVSSGDNDRRRLSTCAAGDNMIVWTVGARRWVGCQTPKLTFERNTSVDRFMQPDGALCEHRNACEATPSPHMHIRPDAHQLRLAVKALSDSQTSYARRPRLATSDGVKTPCHLIVSPRCTHSPVVSHLPS